MLINVCCQPAAFINVSQLRLRKFIHLLSICGAPWGCETSKRCSFPLSGSRKAISQSTVCVKHSDLARPSGTWDGDQQVFVGLGDDQREPFLEEMTRAVIQGMGQPGMRENGLQAWSGSRDRGKRKEV